MQMKIEVRLLGPLEVRGPNGPVRFTGARRRAVFALLALRTGRLVSRSALVDGLWGEDVPPTGTKTLQGHVAKVRRALELAGADGVVLTREPGYLLDVTQVVVDVEEFDEHLRCGRYAEALALHRGDPLADCPVEGWAGAEIVRLREALAFAEENHAAALCLDGRYAEAIAQLERLVALYPLRESLWDLLMEAQHRAGRAGDALRTYRRVRALLVEEFGMEPGTALRRREAAVLAG
ncbi:AfsR/SARP family transcriptional regulator [Lentzea sp. BCCO 10_0798]|jgi:DNA-binding SARP family transcriptional activator|uniref:AfsR/SARP family transcriptional regulator n=1 Tax=Lentzea kristufekii TaxID=3095430 RepID=A0ABU4TTN5_9PSEU|nr:AfsR/SARP family transcriptional regulator [Lentzea sp. BCCO 10_0798]MDX8051650.1 AfsR/SARP family transcriptional regulator [Lentzea sp. BCCO 10_0798]